MKTLFTTVIIFLLGTAPFAQASQNNGDARGTKLHTPRIVCQSITANMLASEAPDGTYGVLLDIILKDGSLVTVIDITDKLKSLTDIDETIMQSSVRCNPSSGLPELIIPEKSGTMLKVFTMDSSGRLTMRLENE